MFVKPAGVTELGAGEILCAKSNKTAISPDCTAGQVIVSPVLEAESCCRISVIPGMPIKTGRPGMLTVPPL
jgi:hypothetical protein